MPWAHLRSVGGKSCFARKRHAAEQRRLPRVYAYPGRTDLTLETDYRTASQYRFARKETCPHTSSPARRSRHRPGIFSSLKVGSLRFLNSPVVGEGLDGTEAIDIDR
jgi:hypothetical protein